MLFQGAHGDRRWHRYPEVSYQMWEEKSASPALGEVREGCFEQLEALSLLSLSSPLPPSIPISSLHNQGDARQEKEISPL